VFGSAGLDDQQAGRRAAEAREKGRGGGGSEGFRLTRSRVHPGRGPDARGYRARFPDTPGTVLRLSDMVTALLRKQVLVRKQFWIGFWPTF
jgi:hypothetical protein